MFETTCVASVSEPFWLQHQMLLRDFPRRTWVLCCTLVCTMGWMANSRSSLMVAVNAIATATSYALNSGDLSSQR